MTISAVHTHHRANENHLLGCLPEPVRTLWEPHLEQVDLELGQVLYEAQSRLSYVYFPRTAIVSLLNTLENGASAEIAVVGNEGIVGIALFMGGDSTPSRAIVQSAGKALRMKAQFMKHEFKLVPPVMHLMLRYTQALITQIAQTAVCNRHHSVDQQLCRWLLLNIDRLQGGELVITQELIANMLGVRREGVTESAGNLQHAGLIKYRRGHIAVLDRSGLEKRSCECYRVVRNEYARLLPDRTATNSVLVQRPLSPDANEPFRARDCKNLITGQPASGPGSPRCSGDSPIVRRRSRPIANSFPPLRPTIVQHHVEHPVLNP
jgi:CRP-like cAMP-binding protein